MNILRLAEQLAAAEDKTVILDAERCLHHRDRLQSCQLCFDVCPVGAIKTLVSAETSVPEEVTTAGSAPVEASTAGDQAPQLDGTACAGCLACLPVCPNGAFTALDEVADLFRTVRAVGAERVELLCQHNPNPDHCLPGAGIAVRVRGCLAGLGVGTLLHLVAEGRQVVIRDDGCTICPWEAAATQISRQVTRARQLLGLWEREEAISFSGPMAETWVSQPFLQAGATPISRRSLFSLRMDEAEGDSNGGSSLPGGDHPFRERLRLVGALHSLGAPEVEAWETPLPVMDLATVAVESTCTACGACSRICPTGALVLEVDEEAYNLTFASLACIGCSMCVHVCPVGAVALNDAPTYDEVFGAGSERILRQGPVRRCRRCRTPFPAATGNNYCDVCEHRRRNRFTPKLPAALRREPAATTLREAME